MPRRKAPEDLSVEELRRLLIEKRRGVRRERLEHFRKTGRVVDVAPPTVETPEITTADEIPSPMRAGRSATLRAIGMTGFSITKAGRWRALPLTPRRLPWCAKVPSLSASKLSPR